jgi:hypothetical protein
MGEEQYVESLLYRGTSLIRRRTPLGPYGRSIYDLGREEQYEVPWDVSWLWGPGPGWTRLRGKGLQGRTLCIVILWLPHRCTVN